MRDAQLITLFDKTVFEYSYLAAGGNQVVILERALPTIPFYWLWMGIRVHAIDVGGGTGTFTFDALNTLPSDEDPADFTIASPLVMSIGLNSTTTAPSLLIATASAAGPMLRLRLTVRQATAAAGKMYAEVSGVIYGRAS
jgi:hypothetical protein